MPTRWSMASAWSNSRRSLAADSRLPADRGSRVRYLVSSTVSPSPASSGRPDSALTDSFLLQRRGSVATVSEIAQDRPHLCPLQRPRPYPGHPRLRAHLRRARGRCLDQRPLRRLYEKTTIVRDVKRNKATYRDQRVVLAVHVSQAWVEWQDGWRMAAIQFSPLAEG
jgi:hypothetical protein